MKNMRNLFRLKTQNEASKDRIIRDIRNLFGEEEEDYYNPVRMGNFWSRDYIKYESNGGRNKTLSIEQCLREVKPYLKDIINDFKKSETLKIQLTIAINFVSLKDTDE